MGFGERGVPPGMSAKGKKKRRRAQYPPHKVAVDGHFLSENVSVVFVLLVSHTVLCKREYGDSNCSLQLQKEGGVASSVRSMAQSSVCREHERPPAQTP